MDIRRIHYETKIINGRLSIVVLCPKCSSYGYLIKYGKKYRIVHKGRVCTFGTCSEFYEILDYIYIKIRGDKRGKN